MGGRRFRAIVGLVAALGVGGVLGLYRVEPAASQPPKLPFSNSVEQRAEMIKELREIRRLLEEQNRILLKQSPSRRDPPRQPMRTPARRSGR